MRTSAIATAIADVPHFFKRNLHGEAHRRAILHGSATATVLIAARMGFQALVIVGIARLMGADGYGAFASVVSLASLFAPFAGLGADFIAMRATARDTRAALPAFYSTLKLIVASAVPLMLVCGLISACGFADHVSTRLIVAVLVADLLLMRVTELAAKIFQGASRVFEMGLIRLLPAMCRLIGLAVLYLSSMKQNLDSWALCYFVASGFAAMLSIVWVRVEYPVADNTALDEFRWQDGLHFAGGVTSVRLHSEADKALVLGLAGPEEAGIYAAAVRVIEFTLIPIVGVVSAAYGRLFSEAHHAGAARLAVTALRSSATALALGCVVSVALWFGLVPVLRLALGPEFEAVAEGLAGLALFPLFISLRMTGEQNVAALGALQLRTMVQWGVALVALATNFLVIPRAGWVGAAWICVVAEAMLGLCYFVIVRRAVAGRSVGSIR